MTTYTCDRCGRVLEFREDDKGGAHRLFIIDKIPWAVSSTAGGASVPDTDLCGKCLDQLKTWLKTKVTQ